MLLNKNFNSRGIFKMRNFDKKPSLKPVVGAVIAASGVAASSMATAGTYTSVISGALVNQSSDIMGVPGVASGYNPPLYQNPRLVPFGGPGWGNTLTISIDSQTGEVTDFETLGTSGFVSGSGGPQGSVQAQGNRFVTGLTFPQATCGVTSANPGETGTIIYDCPIGPAVINQPFFASRLSPGYKCTTPAPSSTNFAGGNGCGNNNSGVTFPGGIPNFGSPAVSNGAHIAVPAFASNSPYSLLGSNPAFYSPNDPQQVFNGVAVRELQSGRNGGTFTIKHSGAFSTGDFAATNVHFFNRGNANFPVGGGALPPGEFITFNEYDFNTAQGTTFTPSVDDLGKDVPAMGAFGLAALFGGLIAIAARLRRRIS